VVYGYPAIVVSIPVYVEVEAEPSPETVIESGPASLGTVDLIFKKDEIEVGPKAREQLTRYMSYVVSVLEDLGLEGVRLRINSPLPVGAGLGTSAAVTVGSVAALNALKRNMLDKREIAKKAWEIEKKVQGRASPMDTAASALGGTLWISKEDEEWKIERLEVSDLKLVIAIFPKKKTTAELVREVAERVKNREIYKDVMELIGRVTKEARKALEEGDLKALGELMDLNHSLLDALGVVTPEVSHAVKSAKSAGALGAKASGAGGGGAVVALAEEPKQVAAAFKASGAQRVLIIESVAEGVTVEFLS
jgi:mevalonate kinase